MIKSKNDLKEYMEADRIHLGYTYEKPKIRDIVWRYEIYLRKAEYYNNVSGGYFIKLKVITMEYYGIYLDFYVGFQ